MANLTEDRKSIRKDGITFSIPTAANTVIYAGALVCVNAGGYAAPAADDATHSFAGKADKRADNSAGMDGDIRTEGRREGVFEYNASGMSIADMGEDVYIVDDNTVGKGVAVQPVNVTGVVVGRVPASRGGVYALAYVAAGTTLSWGGGAAVNVGAGGDFTLTAPDGSQILVSVTSGSLPGVDQSDSVTLRHVRCGSLAEVASATSVYVDIFGAVRR